MSDEKEKSASFNYRAWIEKGPFKKQDAVLKQGEEGMLTGTPCDAAYFIFGSKDEGENGRWHLKQIFRPIEDFPAELIWELFCRFSARLKDDERLPVWKRLVAAGVLALVQNEEFCDCGNVGTEIMRALSDKIREALQGAKDSQEAAEKSEKPQ